MTIGVHEDIYDKRVFMDNVKDILLLFLLRAKAGEELLIVNVDISTAGTRTTASTRCAVTATTATAATSSTVTTTTSSTEGTGRLTSRLSEANVDIGEQNLGILLALASLGN
jgi:hypothetical protein